MFFVFIFVAKYQFDSSIFLS